MRIIQITDLHIGKEGEDTHGVDVRQNFLRILNYALAHEPDYLVFTGDLCYKSGEAAIYDWIKQQLEPVETPMFFLSGNHDHAPTLAHTLGIDGYLKNDQIYYAAQWDGKNILFLDSSSGVVPEKQLNWIEEQLQEAKGELLVFLHHPLMKANVPFMDNKYPLKNGADLQDLLMAYPAAVHVFCGHYHVEKTIRKKNILLYLTPSCFFQIHPLQEDFRIDHYRIGLRLIDWQDDRLETTVRYLDGSRLRRFEEDEL